MFTLFSNNIYKFIKGNSNQLIVSLLLIIIIVCFFSFKFIFNFLISPKKKTIVSVSSYCSTNREICRVALLISITLVLVIFIGNTFYISILPQVRVFSEALVVKLVAYFFGPIIGMLVAFITDLVIILFVPVYINWLYTLGLIFIGFIAGVIGNLRRRIKYNYRLFLFFINIFVILSIFLIAFFFASTYENFTFLGITINKISFLIIFAFSSFCTIAFLFFQLHSFQEKKRFAFFCDILAIFLLSFLVEHLVQIFLFSYADVALFNFTDDNLSANWKKYLLFYLFISPWKIIFHTIIIYSSFHRLRKLL